MPELFEDLEIRRAEVERHKENAARLAEAAARFVSNGQGSVEFERRIDFGVTFVREPTFTYGAAIDMDEIGDALSTDVHSSKGPPMPITSGYVVDWDRDHKGYYIGAWVGARVYYPPEDLVPLQFAPRVVHHYRFSTIAMKNVPMDLTD